MLVLEQLMSETLVAMGSILYSCIASFCACIGNQAFVKSFVKGIFR